jgi:hypothetical protein
LRILPICPAFGYFYSTVEDVDEAVKLFCGHLCIPRCVSCIHR